MYLFYLLPDQEMIYIHKVNIYFTLPEPPNWSNSCHGNQYIVENEEVSSWLGFC